MFHSEQKIFLLQNPSEIGLVGRIWAKMFWLIESERKCYDFCRIILRIIFELSFWAKIFWLVKSGRKYFLIWRIWAVWNCRNLVENVLINKIWAKRCWLAEFGLKLFTWHYLSKIVFDYHDLSENVMIVRIWAKLFYYSEFLRQNLNKTVLIERKCD